ncbi:MAG TPA: type II toxin-antitoxin system CcdA family antitoxin [Alphaproteobacteria bacterium]|nr:type II toxin-antitoxin system CcdA family antitoxin [Alphaproteobacteria bacterium]
MRAKSKPQSVTRRRPTNVSLNRELLDEARALNINISQAAERGLALQISEARAKTWRSENKKSTDAWNAYVDRHGLPLSRYRQF